MALIDLCLKSRVGGVATARRLLVSNPNLKIIYISSVIDMVDQNHIGHHQLVSKDQDTVTFLNTIKSIAGG